MTHTEIEAFFAICRHKSISGAAADLYITQSSLSTRLKTLEDALGCPLLIRGKGKRDITLTAQGQAFYDLALQYRDILQKMSSVGRSTLSEKLRVSAINSVGNYLLPPVLDRFIEKYPHIPLTVQDMEAENACISIIRGQTDMAFSTAKVQNDQIVATPFLNDPFTLICSADAPYSDNVTIEQLSVWDEVYIKWSADYEFWHQSAFGSHYMPQISLELMGQIELFVSKTGKWALVPRSIAARVCRDGSVRQCTPAFSVPDRSIYILRHRDNTDTPTIKLFMDTAHEVFEEIGQPGLLL
ncbi:MAG: LysR family transcriptional regulator [Clostridia bacterium]|nr:LysR family transcriptional regulator [Clostridia bacterium]MBR4955839.1 LysR family transcriptional regulator [Clostridia bacterium]MBR5903664.1 LysR family transcriptional regulator [Clostridia bacterium]